FDWRKWTPAGETGPAAEPAVGSFGREFGAGGRIRIREGNRALVVFRLSLDHPGVEEFRPGAHADDAGRLERLDRLDKCGHRRDVLRERFLKIGEVLPRGHEQAVDVE